ncbi:hypothetical protein [Zavarzinia aquatilis]|uniref:Uncharacterized protein n=1 Tax=Zavarzinia aquatilis TaxID=2211142 RepID=A0A317EBV8_9PROT|nr:hypothetical protein [Zavarzinia aquatilis]PWR24548.1 hypothetical protein DKG74_07010 [Zavarzinia aquatilis]
MTGKRKLTDREVERALMAAEQNFATVGARLEEAERLLKFALEGVTTQSAQILALQELVAELVALTGAKIDFDRVERRMRSSFNGTSEVDLLGQANCTECLATLKVTIGTRLAEG